MKILVIPDIHEKYGRMLDILSQHDDSDEVVFLGDLFDSLAGVTENTNLMIYWLVGAINNPKYKFCLGNHDAHYMPCGHLLRCSGYDNVRQAMIDRKIGWDIWRKFRLAYLRDGHVLSHAGIHEKLLQPPFTQDRFDFITTMVFDGLRDGEAHPLLKAGWSRGGTQAVGGINWLDWRDDFEPIQGVNQIVGHTKHMEPRQNHHIGSNNWCIDTDLGHVAIIEDGKVRIEEV